MRLLFRAFQEKAMLFCGYQDELIFRAGTKVRELR